jgi:hypothetical protein
MSGAVEEATKRSKEGKKEKKTLNKSVRFARRHGGR